MGSRIGQRLGLVFVFWYAGVMLVTVATSLSALGLVKETWAFLASMSNLISALFGIWFIQNYFKSEKTIKLMGSVAVRRSSWLSAVCGGCALLALVSWWWPKFDQLYVSLAIYLLFICHDRTIRSGVRSNPLFGKSQPEPHEAEDVKELTELYRRVREWSNGINVPSFLILCLLLGYSLVESGRLPILNLVGRVAHPPQPEVYLAGAIAFHLLLSLYMFARENVKEFRLQVDVV